VRRAIKPNLIFFWGPPAVGKSTVAKQLAAKTKYLYIDFEKFVKDNRLKTDQEKTNKLIEYCDTVPHMCIVVDSFFTDARQAQIFFDHFVEPQYVFHLDAPKDEVIMNIARYYPHEKDRIF
jgi:broad-specificity NMP kinase